jgi:hypothetical protein
MNMCIIITTLLVVLSLQIIFGAAKIDRNFDGKAGGFGTDSLFGNRKSGKEKKIDDAKNGGKKADVSNSYDRLAEVVYDQLPSDKISVSSFFPNNADKSKLFLIFFYRF